MIHKIYYNYKDVLKAPRIAIGPQRIYLATLGMAIAHITYFFFTYLSLILSGYEITTIWSDHGLFPTAFHFILSLGGLFINWIGIIATAFILLLTSTSVCRAVYMYLRNNYFYTTKQALFFAFRNSKSILSIYITFLLLIFPFILAAVIMTLLGHIAWIGDLLNALATLPYIFAGMILVFMMICLLISFLLGPAVIASKEEDGFGTVIQCIQLTWGQPWRMAFYGLLTLTLSILGIFAFAFVLKLGLIIYSVLFMPLMHSMAPILNNALHYIELSIGGLDVFIRELIGPLLSKVFYLKSHYLAVELSTSGFIASLIIYFSLMIAGYMSIGYGLAIAGSALTISYVIFEAKLTDNDLLKRKDSEIEEDKEAFEFNIEANTKNLSEQREKKE